MPKKWNINIYISIEVRIYIVQCPENWHDAIPGRWRSGLHMTFKLSFNFSKVCLHKTDWSPQWVTHTDNIYIPLPSCTYIKNNKYYQISCIQQTMVNYTVVARWKHKKHLWTRRHHKTYAILRYDAIYWVSFASSFLRYVMLDCWYMFRLLFKEVPRGYSLSNFCAWPLHQFLNLYGSDCQDDSISTFNGHGQNQRYLYI